MATPPKFNVLMTCTKMSKFLNKSTKKILLVTYTEKNKDFQNFISFLKTVIFI